MNHSFRAGFVEAVTTLTRAYCNSSGSVYSGVLSQVTIGILLWTLIQLSLSVLHLQAYTEYCVVPGEYWLWAPWGELNSKS